MTLPKVSIVIPVYNGSDYLHTAISSALGQRYENVEVLVVDDGSTDLDATERIAKSFGDRIRYFHKSNGGVATALNLGIEQMQGEYFSWLSHDDVYKPDKIERQIEAIQQRCRQTIAFSDYDFIDREGNYIGTCGIMPIPQGDMYIELIHSYPLNGCTLLIHRDWFAEVGTFNTELKTTQDYDFWFRLAKRADFLHINRPLIDSRLHDLQGSRKNRSIHKRECIELYSGALDDLLLVYPEKNLPEREILLLKALRGMTRKGCWPVFRKALKLAWAENRGVSIHNIKFIVLSVLCSLLDFVYYRSREFMLLIFRFIKTKVSS